MKNRLAAEKSPYLRQHGENPVDWYPWGEEAFEKARNEDKPVFLSVGYATCHWCHVMARESFEDQQVAALMNKAFVNVKLDREERPDIDLTYMTVCQLLTGQGGWPLTIVMTPDKKPFFAATYLPKKSRFGRLGMLDLIPQISEKWKSEREKILSSAEKISKGFARTLDLPSGDLPGLEPIRQGRNELQQRFDTDHGGFGDAPKFPSPHQLTFLIQYERSFDDPESLHMVSVTLEAMRLGGLWDHIGFGFHRYSTDSRWLLPHFEKMLYDQAMLMIAYAEGWKSTGDQLFYRTVSELARYLEERLTSEQGGFFSAEDADSEGEEGKFYLWSLEEVRKILPGDEAELIEEVYQLELEGNFREEVSGRKTGANIPHLQLRPEKQASEQNMEAEAFNRQMESIREKLKLERQKRIRPFRDEKILTDWNGLMIAALARAGRLTGKPSYVESAARAFSFIHSHLTDPSGQLKHRYMEGEAAIPAMAADYAYLGWGAVELYQAAHDPGVLKSGIELTDILLDKFWDEERGGIFFTAQGTEELLGRQKEIHDGAIPSGNSVFAMNLINLSRLTGRTEYDERADALFGALSQIFRESPSAVAFGLEALMRVHKPSAEVILCGEPDHNMTAEMMEVVHSGLKDPYVFHLKTPENEEELAKLAPYTGEYPLEAAPALYLCRNFRCETPIRSADELRERLKSSEQG